MSEPTVRDAVASHTSDFELRRELHRVRPHVTHELDFEDERAVCKVSTHPEGDAGLEGRVLAAVGEQTSLPVPELLAVGDDHFVARWDDHVPQAPPEVTERRVRAVAHGLASLHAATEDWFDSTGLLTHLTPGKRPLDHTDDATWGDTLSQFLDRRVAYLDRIGFGGVAERTREWFASNRAPFDRVDDAVLVHGNFFAEHVGVDAGVVSAVVDFEHALVGSPEWDYVRTVQPVFGPTADHDVPESVFREAYESVRALPAGFDRRCEGYRTLTICSYLRSLHLQRGNLDSTHDVARRLRSMATYLDDRLASGEVRGESHATTGGTAHHVTDAQT